VLDITLSEVVRFEKTVIHLCRHIPQMKTVLLKQSISLNGTMTRNFFDMPAITWSDYFAGFKAVLGLLKNLQTCCVRLKECNDFIDAVKVNIHLSTQTWLELNSLHTTDVTRCALITKWSWIFGCDIYCGTIRIVWFDCCYSHVCRMETAYKHWWPNLSCRYFCANLCSTLHIWTRCTVKRL